MSHYTQLTHEERYQISVLKKAGHKVKEIAKLVNRHISTIYRELKRNTGKRGYRPKQAHEKAFERRQDKVSYYFLDEHWVEVERLIRQEWSPEQVSLRLAEEQDFQISAEWIYQYIYEDQAQGGDLYHHLRCQKQRRKRYGKKDYRGRIPNQTSIEERPDIVDDKGRLGDWEGDTIIGTRHQGAIVSLVERRSQYTLLGLTRHKTAELVTENIISLLKPYRSKVHTITFDNGREFSNHEELAEQLKTDIYFAHPYASWERGLNENTNGLVRQYFPKNKDFTIITQEEIEFVMNQLNHRPRKSLGGKTPFEVFFNKSTRLTFALTT